MKPLRTEQRSLSQDEYAALPPEAQKEYSRRVRRANADLYSPDFIKRWSEAMQLQADHQADHQTHIENREWIK